MQDNKGIEYILVKRKLGSDATFLVLEKDLIKISEGVYKYTGERIVDKSNVLKNGMTVVYVTRTTSMPRKKSLLDNIDHGY